MYTHAEQEVRHLDELARLEAIISDMGHSCRMMLKSDTTPFHTLLVRLQSPVLTRPYQLGLTFYPIEVDEVKHSLLLQYYMEISLRMSEGEYTRVEQLLSTLNNRVVLGHFGLTPATHTLHYRYVQALPKTSAITHESVADAVMLVGFAPVLFIDTIEAFARGEINLAAAIAEVDNR